MENRCYERGQSQTFYNEFFEIFGVKRRRVASFEEPVKKLGDKQGFIDLFWKGVLLVEQKSAGRDLTKAKQQAFDYFHGLKESELPRYILACDFQTFQLYDLDENESHSFGLQELPDKIKLFSFIDGGIQHKFKDEDPVNIKASELMGDLHDALKAAGYESHDLERFLVRLVFCLFADDTGIFERGILTQYIETRTSKDGADLGPQLSNLFQVLNTHEDKRQKTLDEDLADFPYVNGELFAERLALPDFNSAMRTTLLEACHFNWSKVSPAIFGSLFQSVMDKKKRRAIGAHYTNEQNIMKVIGPLFLDDLKAELTKLKLRKDSRRSSELKAFQEKLSKITCLDPACGCGNFLVIAYRELRQLETEVILELRNDPRVRDLFSGNFSQVDVDQFYGIEIEEFPARIAETALWMMDHIMNMRLSEAVGEYQPRIPLKAKPTIKHADALDVEWSTVLPPEQCSYVFGNPPFVGKHLMSPEQSKAVAHVFNNMKGTGNLDFVTAWFLLTARYIQKSQIECALVSTNSISQGEQVSLIWRELLKLGVIINFAHRTFEWGSEARGKAHVHCVIVGFSLIERSKKTIFEYPKIDEDPIATEVKRISPYLIDAGNTLVDTKDSPPTGILPAAYGSKPVDKGNLLFTPTEKIAFEQFEPRSKEFFKPIVSGEEFINGDERWALWLSKVGPEKYRNIPLIMDRVEKVKNFRLASKKIPTQRAAMRAYEFAEIRQPKSDFIAIPQHSSERREYVPFGFFTSDYAVHNSCTCIADGGLNLFSLITSRMHMSWLRFIGGRLKSDYRYSIGLVYNPFPWPDLDEDKKEKLNKLGQAILDARLNHPQSTLADLYDPLTMPADLRKAHEANDKAVDQLYRKETFASDRARVEFLLARYEQITAPALALAAQKPKKGKKARAMSIQ